MIKDFIMANWIDIVIIAGVIGLLIGLWKSGKKTAVKKIAYGIIKQADIKFDATSDEKFEQIYQKLPRIIRSLYSVEDIRKIVDDIFTDLENVLSDSEK